MDNVIDMTKTIEINGKIYENVTNDDGENLFFRSVNTSTGETEVVTSAPLVKRLTAAFKK